MNPLPQNFNSPFPPVNRWFAQRRDFFIKNVFKDFHSIFLSFADMYEEYAKTNRIEFADIALLVGAEKDQGLWLLKDRCHQLWRDDAPLPGQNGFFLDWVIGSLFHEAMKLKENSYMLNNYAPLAVEIKEQLTDKMSISDIRCLHFMAGTRQEMNKQMENLGFLFNRGCYLLRIMLPGQAENMLLIRYLIENEHIADDLWSETVDAIFNDVFPGGPEQGYCMAGKNYLDGHWYEQALTAYSDALRINPKCDDALRRLSQAKVILRNKEEVLRDAV